MKDINSRRALIDAFEIKKVFKVDNREVVGIGHANFSVLDGSFTIIHGPSGSGKTTLLNILTGLDRPNEGKILYEGNNIYDLPEAELAHFRARTMGIVHQTSYWVKSLSVLENVALPLYFLGYDKANAEREALESLKRVGLERYADTLPMLLSGGEQQRVSVARALVSNPSYIVADEPTGNLDSRNGDKILELLEYFHKTLGRTIILVTHNENYLKYATQLLRINDGVVTEDFGNHKRAEKYESTHRTPLGSVLEKLRPIRLSMLLRMAAANLVAKKFRNNLTMLGVAIGVSAVFLLLSFGLGLQHLVQKEIIGTDSVRVINVTSVNSDVLRLNADTAEKIRSMSATERTGVQYTAAGDFRLDSANADAVIYGVDQDYLTLNNLVIAAGTMLQPNQPDQLIISKTLVSTLGYDDVSKVINKKITLTLNLDEGESTVGAPLTIVGVVDASSGSAMYVSSDVFVKLGVSDYHQLKVVAKQNDSVSTLRKQIETMGYQTSSPLDTIDQINRFFGFFNLLLVGFGGVGMLIATIGMLNTLTVALFERTKEVGLMITLGARRRDMRRLFITEALLLTTIGGIVGIVFSLVLAFIVNVISNQLAAARGVSQSFSLFAVPPWLVIVILLFICIIGYLVSLLPAHRAGKIAPVEALRRE